jgi:hypothetical protein
MHEDQDVTLRYKSRNMGAASADIYGWVPDETDKVAPHCLNVMFTAVAAQTRRFASGVGR